MEPPPSTWQADLAVPWADTTSVLASIRGPAGGSRVPAGPLGATKDVEQISTAWKHVKGVVRDDGKPVDLYDLLAHNVRDIQYTFQPQGWPALLRANPPFLSSMPGLVTERYNNCRAACFCGLFPELKRAWASIDTSLYIWRFDRGNDVPIEYSAEEQAICAVGLVKPQSGIFVEAISYLLVVCTTTEVVLLGVCCGPTPADDITLQALPLYSLPTDGITMVGIAGTPQGRIFLGGANGHLYEILYSQPSSMWRSKRCSKKDHTGGLGAYFPPMLAWTAWVRPVPLVELVVDPDRRFLYGRYQNSAIQVWDLGADGQASSLQGSSIHDMFSAAQKAVGGRDIFGGRSAADRKGAAIVKIVPIPPSESTRLHLLALTADARRIYLSAYVQPGYMARIESPRPDRLKCEFARQALPTGPAGVGHPAGRGVEVTAAAAGLGVLVLADGSGTNNGMSRIMMASADHMLPSLSTATGQYLAYPSLRETVSEIDTQIPGEVCAIAYLEPARPPDLAMRNELATELFLGPQRYALISTAGVLKLEKRRPVDTLRLILEERSPPAKLEHFFKAYGPAEVAVMCFLLITSSSEAVSAVVVQGAKAALENPRLTGEPDLREDASRLPGMPSGVENITPNLGFDMGQAVPVAEPEWSGAHRGLCIYTSRVLEPAWEELITEPTRKGSPALRCRIPVTTLLALEERLRSLAAFLVEYQQRQLTRSSRLPGMLVEAAGAGAGAGGRTYEAGGLGGWTPSGGLGPPPAKRPRLEEASKLEDQKTAAVRALVQRAAEGCFLLRILVESNLPRLLAGLGPTQAIRMASLRLRDWVASPEGETVAAALVSALVGEHLSTSGGVAEDLGAILQAGCPSYFREDDAVFYKASGLLQEAESATAPADRQELLREAIRLMFKVPLSVDLVRVVPQLVQLRAFEALVELPVRRAAALDPANTAALPGDDGRAARQVRYDTCYKPAIDILKFLIDPKAGEGDPDQQLSPADRNKYRSAFLQAVAKADDACFKEVVYDCLVGLKQVEDLVSLDCPALETYLRSRAALSLLNGSMAPVGPLSKEQVLQAEILAKLYIARQDYGGAARVYAALAARRSGVGDEGVSLDQRCTAFQCAFLQAKAAGDADEADRFEVRARLLDVQKSILDQLERQIPAVQGDESVRRALDTVAELKEGVLELADLFNDYAVPRRLWRSALDLVALAGYGDPATIHHLWDAYLRQGWDESIRRGREAAFEELCARAEAVGEAYGPDADVFPGPYVIFRLEQTAAGLWPEPGPAFPDLNRVPAALLRVCRGSAEAVLKRYEVLLAGNAAVGSDGNGELTEELGSPELKLRSLQSLVEVVSGAAQALLERAAPAAGGLALRGPLRREAGGLKDACEQYAGEARKIPRAGGLVATFQAVGQSLDGLTGCTHFRR